MHEVSRVALVLPPAPKKARGLYRIVSVYHHYAKVEG